MKKIILITTTITLFMLLAIQNIDAKSTWHKYNPQKFGVAKSSKIIHYNNVNWGWYDSVYKDKYFHANNNTMFKYEKSNRTMIIRYLNIRNRKFKYNYRKLVLKNGHKKPMVSYYYKINNNRFKYIYTIQYDMKGETKY